MYCYSSHYDLVLDVSCSPPNDSFHSLKQVTVLKMASKWPSRIRLCYTINICKQHIGLSTNKLLQNHNIISIKVKSKSLQSFHPSVPSPWPPTLTSCAFKLRRNNRDNTIETPQQKRGTTHECALLDSTMHDSTCV